MVFNGKCYLVRGAPSKAFCSFVLAMSDHVSKLTTDLLIHELKDVTGWEYMGFYLGFGMADIKEIEQDHPDTARRRMEMLDRWMRKEVSPSWEMVIEALEKMSELRLAHQLREKYCTQQHKDEKPPTTTSEDQRDSQATERELKLHRKNKVAQEIEGLEDKYLVIVREIEVVLKRENPSVREINRFSKYYMNKEVTKIEELFDQLEPLDYLNYTMLEKIMKYFLKQDQPVIAELNCYIQDLEKFKQSTSVQEFMESIEAALRPLSETEISGEITVTLRLVGGWLTKTMNDLDKLLKVLFEDKSSVLSHVKIVRGSVIITYLVPQTEAKSLVTIAAGKISFMVQVGICELLVGDTMVAITQNETSKYSFESSLIRAVYNDDIDVLSFLLNINTAANDDKQTALLLGSLLGNSKAVNVLLKANTNPNIPGQDGATPLHFASHHGHCNIVGMLLNANANPNLQKANGNTPLHLASQEGHSDVVGLLLEARANPNIPRQDGATPLHFASHFGHCNIVGMLLNSNANPNLQTADGSTPLLIASQEGYSDIVDLLLEARVNLNIRRHKGETPLHVASYFGYSNIVSLLLNANANHSLEDNVRVTPLYVASQEGHTDVVTLLLKANADPNHLNGGVGTPLHTASSNGHSDIVRLLLQSNANFNLQADNGATPLHTASYRGHTDIISILLTANANPNSQNKDGMTPLCVASQEGRCGAINLLLEANADPNLSTSNGTTPLYIASETGNSDVVSLLLKASADPNLQRNDGRTPLFLASMGGHCDVVDLLLKANSDPNLCTKDVRTPLMYACFNRYPQVVQLLLTSGADPNLQTVDDGITALMLACHVGCFESAELLLMYGADSSLRSHDGLTALDMAACEGHDDIVDVIHAVELSQSSSTSPVLTATEIAINVDNKALASLYQAMEKMLLEKTESIISAKHQQLEKIIPYKQEQELQ